MMHGSSMVIGLNLVKLAHEVVDVLIGQLALL